MVPRSFLVHHGYCLDDSPSSGSKWWSFSSLAGGRMFWNALLIFSLAPNLADVFIFLVTHAR